MEELENEELMEEVDLTEEEEEAYLTQILDEAIESFRKNPKTISLEEWREELIREFHVNI